MTMKGPIQQSPVYRRIFKSKEFGTLCRVLYSAGLELARANSHPYYGSGEDEYRAEDERSLRALRYYEDQLCQALTKASWEGHRDAFDDRERKVVVRVAKSKPPKPVSVIAHVVQPTSEPQMVRVRVKRP